MADTALAATTGGTGLMWARYALDLPGQRDLPGPLGATALEDGSCRFVVWAPFAERVEVRIPEAGDRTAELRPAARGYYVAEIPDVGPGTLYRYRLDGDRELPDPASRHQPDGVHGLSRVVDPEFSWEDDGWAGPALRNLIFYELHVGTFTGEGTLDAIVPRLDDLVELGVTAVELMPVAQFPGERNWGYDGTYPFAVQHSYGGPRSLKKFVNECHKRRLAVVLDVVYNHLGPEGAYLGEFGPYFTDRYHTPWGRAVNFDGAGSDAVRRFFVENALYWADRFHIDAFRLDAVDTILDTSPRTFLSELSAAIHELGAERNRRIHLIAEDDSNSVELLRPREQGGDGLDAAWNDDFHHALHALLTGERGGYYEDFGGLAPLAKAVRRGFVYTGQYSIHRGRRQGSDARTLPGRRLVVFAQNHDQVGNRGDAARLGELVSEAEVRMAAAAVILSPFLPLLFMGEEYGETARFPYFVSHSDPDLVEAVRAGRREEFSSFRWGETPPDPQAESTFRSAVLNHDLREEAPHSDLLAYYRELIRLRKEVPALSRPSKRRSEVGAEPERSALWMRRWSAGSEAFAAWNFGRTPADLSPELPPGRWTLCLDSAAGLRAGDGGEPDTASTGGETGGAAENGGDGVSGPAAPPRTLASGGRVALTLPPLTTALYVRSEGGRSEMSGKEGAPPGGGMDAPDAEAIPPEAR